MWMQILCNKSRLLAGFGKFSVSHNFRVSQEPRDKQNFYWSDYDIMYPSELWQMIIKKVAQLHIFVEYYD